MLICDSNQLQLGVYKIKASNFDQADGRTVTAQLASYNDGVIANKQVKLGKATFDNPVYNLFNIRLYKNLETNQINLELID